MASRKRSFPANELFNDSLQAIALLEESSFFQQANVLVLYDALPDELQTRPLLNRWYQQKELWLPVVEGNDLKLVRYIGEDQLEKGAFGIWEPVGLRQDITAVQPDMLVVPGVAFDRDGNRLGRGKGFYDRLLQAETAFKVGFCFDFQLLPQIPVESFDMPMDAIVTNREIIELRSHQ